MEDNNETLQPETEQFEDGLETNLVNIARIIFSRPPQPPYSIQLQLDDGSISQNQHDTKTIINEMLTIFLLAGIQIKWGDDFRLKDITDEHLEILKQYSRSIGYEPIIEIEPETESFTVEFQPYRVRP